MRLLRLLVMFDLPTGNAKQRKSYTDFRKSLLENGFEMEQFSVYSRIVNTREAAQRHIQRMKGYLPLAGVVTVLILSENQYARRQVLVNTHAPKEPAFKSESQLTLLF